MDNIKNDDYYAYNIRDDVRFIVKNMKDVDLDIIYKTLKDDIPELLEYLKVER